VSELQRNARDPLRPKRDEIALSTVRALWRELRGAVRQAAVLLSAVCVPRPNFRRSALDARRAERPPYDQLLREVADLGWSGTGRKHGVSDNAIRKWVRAYERAADAGEAA
jgi:hypothetical protein